VKPGFSPSMRRPKRKSSNKPINEVDATLVATLFFRAFALSPGLYLIAPINHRRISLPSLKSRMEWHERVQVRLVAATPSCTHHPMLRQGGSSTRLVYPDGPEPRCLFVRQSRIAVLRFWCFPKVSRWPVLAYATNAVPRVFA
jgi:hypothetical protein